MCYLSCGICVMVLYLLLSTSQAYSSILSLCLLQVAFPILVGRPHPNGHPEYPRMGNYFSVHGGGGIFPVQPSLPTNKAAADFLRDKAAGKLAQGAADALESIGVAEAVQALTSVQGCKLWDCPPDLKGVELSKEQVQSHVL